MEGSIYSSAQPVRTFCQARRLESVHTARSAPRFLGSGDVHGCKASLADPLKGKHHPSSCHDSLLKQQTLSHLRLSKLFPGFLIS